MVKVTIVKTYLIPEHVGESDIKQWFNNINSSHASRDYYEIGGSARVQKIKICKKLV